MEENDNDDLSQPIHLAYATKVRVSEKTNLLPIIESTVFKRI